MTNQELEECLMRGYGYRKTTELRGELIFENHQIVRDTLHHEEVWVRDLVQPANPLNDYDEFEADHEGMSLDEIEEHWNTPGRSVRHRPASLRSDATLVRRQIRSSSHEVANYIRDRVADR
jgi:hypothetical protein